MLLPIALVAVGCSVAKEESPVPSDDGPLPIELNFTVSDPSGNNLLDPSAEGSVAGGDIYVVYNVSSFMLDEPKDGLLLESVVGHDGITTSLSFGKIDGSASLEAAPVSLVVGGESYTVVVTNFYDPEHFATAYRHFYYQNKDWYGKSAIPIVVGAMEPNESPDLPLIETDSN
ncbi:MAG: hypothetical protein IJ795_05380 [Bacteroidales bacterium]|nr:hypothetical protein [Bacteroidales bacterium]